MFFQLREPIPAFRLFRGILKKEQSEVFVGNTAQHIVLLESLEQDCTFTV